MGISQGSYGRRSLLLRRNCLSVSQFEYPSAGCSPAEPACVFPNRLYTPDLETDFKLIEIRREFRWHCFCHMYLNMSYLCSFHGELHPQILLRKHKTVETHRAHIKEKLGCKSAVEVSQFAIDWATRAEG